MRKQCYLLLHCATQHGNNANEMSYLLNNLDNNTYLGLQIQVMNKPSSLMVYQQDFLILLRNKTILNHKQEQTCKKEIKHHYFVQLPQCVLYALSHTHMIVS